MFCKDGIWNTSLTWHQPRPKLTVCFVNVLLTLLPCVLYLVVSLLWFLIAIMNKHKYNFVYNRFHTLKKVLTSLLSLVSLAHLICVAHYKSTFSQEEFISTIIFAAAILWATFCTFYERIRRFKCTSHLTLFWVILTLAQVFVVASSFDTNYNVTTLRNQLLFGFVIAKFAILVAIFVVALQVDRLPPFLLNSSNFPDHKASYCNSITCFWLLKYINIARKKMLSEEDLWRENYTVNSYVLDEDIKETILHLNEVYDVRDNKYEKRANSKLSNFQALRIIIGKDYLTLLNALVVNLSANLLNIVQPMLLSYVINFIAIKDILEWKGYLYAIGLTLVSMVSGLCRSYGAKLSIRSGVTIRSRIMLLVYHKSFKLSAQARDELPESLALTIIGSDSEIFYETMGLVVNMFNLPIIIVIILYLIYQNVNNAMFVGIVILVVCFVMTGVVSTYQKKFQSKNFKMRDQRTNVVFQFFNGIKFFKLYGWELPIKDLINSLRVRELSFLIRSFFMSATAIVVMITGPNWMILATIGIYVSTLPQGFLNPGVIFETVALLNMLRSITILLPLCVFNVVSSWIALKRINKYLNSDEIVEDCGDISQIEEDDRIVMENASFAWETDKPFLKNISFKVKENSLTVVIGKLASGKSSILSALLNEMQLTSGGFYVHSSIAYCPQQAWLRNSTLRENIIMFHEYDADRFDWVVDLCCLSADIDMMPDGINTEIGEKGLNLSGGQKQRISLARAVYDNADVYLLDDVLSAVDAHVGKRLFDNVVGPKGCLRNKTVLFMTNNVSYISQVDQIICLKAGEIIFSGDFKNFTAFSSDPAFKEMISSIKPETDEKEAVPLYRMDRSMERMSFVSDLDLTIDAISADVPVPHKLVEAEDAEIKKLSLTTLRFYLRHFGVGMFLGYAFMFSTSLAALVGLYSWMSHWIEVIIHNLGPKDTPYYLGVFAGLTGAFTVSIYVRSCFMFTGAIKASTRIHDNLFGSLMRAPVSFFEKTPIGRILNRFITDILRMDVTTPQQLSAIGGTFVSLLATFIYIIKANYITVVPLIFVVILTFFIAKYYTVIARQSMSLELSSKSKLVTGYMEVVNGGTSIRVAKMEDKFIALYDKNMDKFLIMGTLRAMTTHWLLTTIQWISSSLILITALAGVIGRNGAIPSEIGVSLNFSISIIAVFMFFLKTLGDIQVGFVSIDRISEYSKIQSEAEWSIPDVDNRLMDSWPSRGEIEFRDYSARYRQDLDCCIKNLNCRIESHHKIAVVGRTGAGKSSLTLCLLRALEADSGAIFIDGANIATLGLHKLRHSMAIVPQDSYLITGTLRYNLNPFGYYSDEEIWTVIKSLEFDKRVELEDAGLDFECTDGGTNLSSGAKQLVALARALLRKPQILILDEATASIDITTDGIIQRAIREQFTNCTIITIAHRINTILDYDKVMVFDKGMLVEYDDIPKLLKDPCSLFFGFANNVPTTDL